MKTNFVFLLAVAAIGTSCNNNPASNSTANAADTAQNNSYTAKPDVSGENKPATITAMAGINDAEFLAKAYSIGVFEVKAGRLAHRMSEDRKVKEFSLAMIDDHTRLGKDVEALMQKKGIALPDKLPDNLKDIYKDLNGLMDKDFDKKYAEVNVDGHKDAIALFSAASSGSKDPDIKKLATNALPELSKHEDMAKALAQEVNSK